MPVTNSGSRPASRRSSSAAPSTSTSTGSRRGSAAGGSPSRSSNGPSTPTQAPPSSQTTNVQDVTTALQASTLNNTAVQLHPRSDSGTRGQPVTALTNQFKVFVQCPEQEQIYKWNVTIKKEGETKDTSIGRVRCRVLQLLLEDPEHGDGVYTDYDKTLISFHPLTSSRDVPEIVCVDFYEPEESGPRLGPRNVQYIVTISLAGPSLPMRYLQQLQTHSGSVIPRLEEYQEALNIVLQKFTGQNPTLTTTACGSTVFPLQNNQTRFDLGDGLWSYRGYARRLRINQQGLSLYVNTTAAAMYEAGWADVVINKWIPSADFRPSVIKASTRNLAFKGVRVRANFGTNRVKPIYCIMHDANNELATASQVKFTCDEHPQTGAPWNKVVSVHWYFKAAYPDIKPHPNSVSMVLNVGSDSRPVYWLASLCEILPGQAFKPLLPSGDQSSAMIEFARRDASKNRAMIESEGLEMLGIQRTGPDPGSAVGTPIQTSLSMSTVNARRLRSPSIVFNGSQLSQSEASKGKWNIQNKRFYQPGKLPKWTVIDLKYPGQ